MTGEENPRESTAEQLEVDDTESDRETVLVRVLCIGHGEMVVVRKSLAQNERQVRCALVV